MTTKPRQKCKRPQNKASVRQTIKKTTTECPTSIVETRTVVTVTRRPKPKTTKVSAKPKKRCTTCAVKKKMTARKPRTKKVVIKGLLPAPKTKITKPSRNKVVSKKAILAPKSSVTKAIKPKSHVVEPIITKTYYLSMAHKITDITPFTKAAMYFAGGGGIQQADATRETFGSQRTDKAKELKWVTTFKAEATLPTVKSVAHALWEEEDNNNYNSHDYRDALIEVMKTYKNVTEIRSDLIRNIGVKEQRYQEEYADYLKEESKKIGKYEKLKQKYDYLKSNYEDLQYSVKNNNLPF